MSLFVKIIVTALLLFVLYITIDIKVVFSLIFKADSSYLISSFFLIYCQYVFNALRWKVFLVFYKCKCRILELVKIILVANFANNFLPTSVGGDFLRTHYIYKKNCGLSASVSPVLIERVIGFVIMILFSSLTLLFIQDNLLSSYLQKIIVFFILSVLFASQFLNKKQSSIYIYTVGTMLIFIGFVELRTSVKFLLIVPLMAILISSNSFKTKLKYLTVIGVFFFGISLVVDLVLNKNFLEQKGHSIWFPIFVGMGEGGSKLIPSPDDGYAFHYDKNLTPRTVEWNNALKQQVIQWYMNEPKVVTQIYLYRIDKLLTAPLILGKPILNSTRLKQLFIIAMLIWLIILFYQKIVKRRILFLLLCGLSISLAQGLFIMVKKHSYYFVFDLFYIYLISLVFLIIYAKIKEEKK
jgi:uncharacterized membrane protein YbhN (UPF0104 family)